MIFHGPREKLLSNGAGVLSDAELLAAVLGTAAHSKAGAGVPGSLLVAQELLEHYGGLGRLFSVDAADLKGRQGIGSQKVAALLAVGELCRRIWRASGSGKGVIRTVDDAVSLFSDLQMETQEVVCAAFLTSRLKMIEKKIVFRGTADSSPASPREIFSLALRCGATRIIVAHNHPSGSVEPSEEDEEFTRMLQESGRILGVPMVDHLIIGKAGRYYSFSRSGQGRRAF